jgi:hypothetical protein
MKTPKHLLQAHRLICGRDKLTRKAHSKVEYVKLQVLSKLGQHIRKLGRTVARRDVRALPFLQDLDRVVDHRDLEFMPLQNQRQSKRRHRWTLAAR